MRTLDVKATFCHVWRKHTERHSSIFFLWVGHNWQNLTLNLRWALITCPNSTSPLALKYHSTVAVALTSLLILQEMQPSLKPRPATASVSESTSAHAPSHCRTVCSNSIHSHYVYVMVVLRNLTPKHKARRKTYRTMCRRGEGAKCGLQSCQTGALYWNGSGGSGVGVGVGVGGLKSQKSALTRWNHFYFYLSFGRLQALAIKAQPRIINKSTSSYACIVMCKTSLCMATECAWKIPTELFYFFGSNQQFRVDYSIRYRKLLLRADDFHRAEM